MKLLLVEDEEMLSSIITKGLSKLGYAVDAVYDGEEALYNYEINEYDLIILDLNIPKTDGLEVLQTIRKNDMDTKILILSARTKIGDRIIGLDEGANDYLIKPFDFGELDARIRNLLRRNFIGTSSILTLDKFRVDTNAKKVCYENETLNLTRKEYNIFEYLILHKNQMISAEHIIEHIWDNEFDPFSNTVRYHIHMLKKKLSSYCDKEIIKNVRGLGYIIEEEEK